MGDSVSHPDYYRLPGGLEVIDIMAATQGEGMVEGFCVCNALKYLCRWRFKGGDEDVAKARDYLDRYLKMRGYE